MDSIDIKIDDLERYISKLEKDLSNDILELQQATQDCENKLIQLKHYFTSILIHLFENLYPPYISIKSQEIKLDSFIDHIKETKDQWISHNMHYNEIINEELKQTNNGYIDIFKNIEQNYIHNQKVKYILKTYKDYTLKQLTDYLLESGYSQKEIESIIESGKNSTSKTILNQPRNAHNNLKEVLYYLLDFTRIFNI